MPAPCFHEQSEQGAMLAFSWITSGVWLQPRFQFAEPQPRLAERLPRLVEQLRPRMLARRPVNVARMERARCRDLADDPDRRRGADLVFDRAGDHLLARDVKLVELLGDRRHKVTLESASPPAAPATPGPARARSQSSARGRWQNSERTARASPRGSPAPAARGAGRTKLSLVYLSRSWLWIFAGSIAGAARDSFAAALTLRPFFTRDSRSESALGAYRSHVHKDSKHHAYSVAVRERVGAALRLSMFAKGSLTHSSSPCTFLQVQPHSPARTSSAVQCSICWPLITSAAISSFTLRSIIPGAFDVA